MFHTIIMNEYEINDKRTCKEFKKITFSGFKKTDVMKEFLNSLLNNKIEPACYWCAELICAGYYQDIWNAIIVFMSKYIHLGNPKLPIYIDLRIQNFKEIISTGYIDNEIKMRNNPKIRKLFAEIICILCESSRKHSFESIKIKRESEFDITQMTERFKAPNTSFANIVFRKEDPKELFIAVNELVYNLKTKNNIQSCYWTEWIIEFLTICSAKKYKCLCDRREFIPVVSEHQKHCVWIIWDTFFKLVDVNNKTIMKMANSLLSIFCLRFTSGVIKRRKYILYYMISIITEPFNLDIPFMKNKAKIEKVTNKIDNIYKQIKKNEVKPETDYLFTNLQQRSNLDKTIEKLEMLNSFM